MKEIEWGAHIRALPDMEFLRDIGDGKKVYTREGERMKIGAAGIDRIMYGCYKERLYEVQIHFRSSSNFTTLKEILFKVYGPGRQSNRSPEAYHWYSKETSVLITYDEISGKGAIDYTFMPIYKERRDDKKLQIVRSWLALLTDMEREVITLRFGFNGRDPHTLESIGRSLSLSPTTVHQIELEATEKLREISKKKEIDLADKS